MSDRMKQIKRALTMSSTLPQGAAGEQQMMMGSAAHTHSHDCGHDHSHDHYEHGEDCKH